MAAALDLAGLAQKVGELEGWLLGLDLPTELGKIPRIIEEVQALRTRSNGLESRLTTLDASHATRTGNSSGRSRVVKVSAAKNLSAAPCYTGKPETYKSWAFRSRNFLNSLDPNYVSLLKMIEASDETLDKDFDLPEWARDNNIPVDDAEDMAREIWHYLHAKTGDGLSHILMSLEEEDEVLRGPLAWKRLQRESYGDKHARLVQLSSEITNPTPELRKIELGEAIDRWFSLLNEFEELQGAKMILPVAMGGLMNLIPPDLKNELKLKGVDTSLTRARDHLKDQARSRRGIGHRASHRDHERAGPQPSAKMQVDYMGEEEKIAEHGSHEEHEQRLELYEHHDGHQYLNAMMKGKGKGGKGNFQERLCHYCQKPGHIKRECQQFTADLQSGKATLGGWNGQKGSGDKGKGKGTGAWGNGGWAWSPQNQQWPQSPQWGPVWKGGSMGGKGGKGHFGKGLNQMEYGGGHCSAGDSSGAGGFTICHLEKACPKYVMDKGTVTTRNTFEPLQDSIADEAPEECQNAPGNSRIATNKDAEDLRTRGPRVVGEQRERFGTSGKHSSVAMTAEVEGLGPSAKARCARQGRWRREGGSRLPQASGEPSVNLLLSESNVGIHNVENGLERIEVIVDSGAADSVAPPSVGRSFRVRESEGSRAGQKYVTADGTTLANLGEKCIKATTNEGHCVSLGFQMADVTKPLASVGRICDSGNEVSFGPNSGCIYNVKTGCMTEFRRVNGVYVLEAWADATGFARPE